MGNPTAEAVEAEVEVEVEAEVATEGQGYPKELEGDTSEEEGEEEEDPIGQSWADRKKERQTPVKEAGLEEEEEEAQGQSWDRRTRWIALTTSETKWTTTSSCPWRETRRK